MLDANEEYSRWFAAQRRKATHAAVRAIVKAEPRIVQTGARRKPWGKQSRFRGVYPTPTGKWVGRLRVGGERLWCGTHNSEEAAALAVDRKCLEVFGTEAVPMLNFPEAVSGALACETGSRTGRWLTDSFMEGDDDE